MHLDEIVLPEDKPAWEWVRGRALQKQLPRLKHGVLQGLFWQALQQWSNDHPGRVATEWDFRVQPPGEVRRPLVPDVAYVQIERLRALEPEARQIPWLAPDIVVEILSPGDRRIDVDHKRDVYVSAGTRLVIIVDPATRTAHTYHADGTSERFARTDVLRSPAFPDLAIDLTPIFAELHDA